MAKQSTGRPTNKVMSSSIGAAIATIVIWALDEFTTVGDLGNIEVALATLITFAFGWFTPPASGDQLADK